MILLSTSESALGSPLGPDLAMTLVVASGCNNSLGMAVAWSGLKSILICADGVALSVTHLNLNR
jgi:hypothetical protein